MEDKNNVEIKVGDLVKRCGNVLYADGFKYKISKKTWKVSKIEKEQIYYDDEAGNDVLLPVPKNEGAFLVVTEQEFEPIPGIKASGVPQKYRVHGDDKERGWEDGDIVQIFGIVSEATQKSGKLERVPDAVAHKHVLVVADILSVKGNMK